MAKLRLGGMALSNGVLVHGPTSWGVAIRDSAGGVRAASGPKRRFAPNLQTPVIRGPLRLAEAFALLPDVKRALPGVRFPFERPRVAVAVVAGSTVAAAARRSTLSGVARESIAAVAALVPAVVALRGGELSSYHGAEHVSIGTYESDGERAPKEHDRCGSHLIGPLLVCSAAGSALAARAPARSRGVARVAGAVGAVGVSVEVFAWMSRNPRHPLSRALQRPGHELQRRLATAEPSEAQLAVAEAALAACLEAEGRAERAEPAEPAEPA
jgi:uncharacterized protein YqhQ